MSTHDDDCNCEQSLRLQAENDRLLAGAELAAELKDALLRDCGRLAAENTALRAEVESLRKFDLDRATRWSAEAMALKARIAELEERLGLRKLPTRNRNDWEQAMGHGAAAERAAIVAWLRSQTRCAGFNKYFADAIESGAHLPAATGPHGFDCICTVCLGTGGRPATEGSDE
jgi:hypothetical protein